MRAVLSIVGLLICSIGIAESYFDAWLLPTTPGKPSKIIPITQNECKDSTTWLQYDDGEANYVLVGLSDVDTMCVYFEPPAPCSVLAMEICVINYYSSVHNTVQMFIALIDTGLTLNDLTLNDWNEYHPSAPIPGNRSHIS